jgi:hypothetical protein
MEYERQFAVQMDVATVLEAARDILMSVGFRVKSLPAGTGYEALGPGQMRNNHENPLLGISTVRLTRAGQSIAIEADFGNLKLMKYFILFFPSALILCLGLLFQLPGLHHDRMAPPFMLKYGPLLGMAFWIPVGMIWWPILRRSTVKSIETMIENAKTVATDQAKKSGMRPPSRP